MLPVGFRQGRRNIRPRRAELLQRIAPVREGERVHEIVTGVQRLHNRLWLQGERPDRSHGELGFSLVAVFGGGWNAFFDYSRLLARDDFERDRISVGVTRDF